MVTVHKAADGKLKQEVRVGNNVFFVDEPESVGGDNQGPTPHELLDAALGACTALTLTMVARRKGFPLVDVKVDVDHSAADGVHTMKRSITLVGDLSGEQKDYLLGIANKCPVHRTLMGKFAIDTALA